MARLMLSAGMFSALAAATAVRKRGFLSTSPPLFAAMLISFNSRVKILPRLASSAPFLCLMVAHLEWPDMREPRIYDDIKNDTRRQEDTAQTTMRVSNYIAAFKEQSRRAAGPHPKDRPAQKRPPDTRPSPANGSSFAWFGRRSPMGPN